MTQSLIVLSESDGDLELNDPDTDMVPLARAAKVAGCPVIFLGGRLRSNSLEKIPQQQRERPALWSGHIAPAADYEAVYEALAQRGLRLLNSPVEHQRALQLDHAYPRIRDLTAETLVVQTDEECDAAVAQLGLPVFIKGNLFSRKHLGWKACVAETTERARAICGLLWREPDRCRDRKVLVRKMLPLRRMQTNSLPFPVAREYRVFLYRSVVVGYGFYWPCLPPFARLEPREASALLATAVEAATRLDISFVSLDIGQLEDDRWVVIETGDPQFSGLSLMDPVQMLTSLSQTLVQPRGP